MHPLAHDDAYPRWKRAAAALIVASAWLSASCYGSHGLGGAPGSDAGISGSDGDVLIGDPDPMLAEAGSGWPIDGMDGGHITPGSGPDGGGSHPIDAGTAPPLDVCASPAWLPSPTCGGGSCGFAPVYAWNGWRCIEIAESCELTLDPTVRIYASMSACEDATLRCDASLCSISGGHWLPSFQRCGHQACGHWPEDACEAPAPACACGPDRFFEPGVGCLLLESAFCAPADEAHLCESTGGRCAGSCACACPHAYHFEEGFGCVLDGPPYECDAFFCPLPEGAACDREASACAPDLVCCSGGRADGLTPTCRRPCDCAVE